MGKAMLVMIVVVLFLYAYFDLRATPPERIHHTAKPVWFLIILVPFFGPVAWLVFGQRQPQSGGGRGTPPRRPQGPDDDPDFLRNL